ncbi:hypothetical protein C8J57DRAFT_1523691 [Mycena rebaudengoi]|nr:hypothetical protein C8J57DRAFT_1523691 [Mycena rebaudengoi]
MDLDDAAELVRSADFWFIDGTIVLQVEQTLFRPAGESADVIDGCPVVHLHDAEVDFTRFLKALHNYESFLSHFRNIRTELRPSAQ